MRTALRRTRQRQGLAVDAIAAKLGITPSFYYKIEQGARNPTIGLAKRIADLLGAEMGALFFGDQVDDASTPCNHHTGSRTTVEVGHGDIS